MPVPERMKNIFNLRFRVGSVFRGMDFEYRLGLVENAEKRIITIVDKTRSNDARPISCHSVINRVKFVIGRV